MDNFDWEFYIYLYDDLKHINNNEDAYKHYKNNGINENRICNRNNNIYNNFDWKFF